MSICSRLERFVLMQRDLQVITLFKEDWDKLCDELSRDTYLKRQDVTEIKDPKFMGVPIKVIK